jgi:hypothetical protein
MPVSAPHYVPVNVKSPPPQTQKAAITSGAAAATLSSFHQHHHHPVDRTAEQLVAGYNVEAGEFLQENCDCTNQEFGGELGEDDETPKRSNKRVRIEV